jgi:hypothetical protein
MEVDTVYSHMNGMTGKLEWEIGKNSIEGKS